MKNVIETTKQKATECLIMARAVMTLVLVTAFIGMVDQTYRVQRAEAAIPSDDLGFIIEEAAEEYDLPPLLIRAIIDQENGPGNDNLSCQRRYEATWEGEARKLAPRASAKDVQAMASSVGVMQVVYAGHARRCGLSSWKDLCDPEVNIRCGASYVRYLIDRRSDPDNSRWYIADRKLRIRTAVKDYNGVGNTNWKYEAGVRSHYERRKGQVKMASNPARNRIPS